METESKLRLADVFVSITDPRQATKVEHDLVELLVVAVNAVLVGADNFVDIELWANERIDWLRSYLRLENGIPSHDTFGRLFGLINPDEFEASFRRWVSAIVPTLGADTVVAIDGKTSRRTGKVGATPLHLVSAFAAGAGLVLGQRATAEKSNEKTAIPELLATLALEGCIVTIDAMGPRRTLRRRSGTGALITCSRSRIITRHWPSRCTTSLPSSRSPRSARRIRRLKRSRRIMVGSKPVAVSPSINSNVWRHPRNGPL